jgi:hypothetical protein
LFYKPQFGEAEYIVDMSGVFWYTGEEDSPDDYKTKEDQNTYDIGPDEEADWSIGYKVEFVRDWW